MCGIAGFAGRFEPALLAAMSERLAHRGPDGDGEFLDAEHEIGLTHRRLAIIDLTEAGRQPMPGAGGALRITFNGEIYNYRDLARDLEDRGHRFVSRSDTEVLLHLYERHGVDMLDRIEGIYAFALWDAREGRLFLARDRFGVKPLYYCETNRGFLFASEIKALLASADVPRDLDPDALNEHLTYLWTAAPRTVLKAVRKLEPGHALEVRSGRISRKWRHYVLPYDGARLDGSADALAGDLRQLLRQAVERQLVSDVPVGAFLSGGLDSSSVVAAMRHARPEERTVCYTIGFRDGLDLEGSPADLPYARQVARHLDADLREIVVGPEIVDQLETMLWHLDEPQADPAAINVLLIAQRAREDGVKVLLSGAGGDDLFSGYRRHLALRLRGLGPPLPAAVRRAMAGWANAVADGGGHMKRRARRLFAHAGLDGDDWLASLFTWSAPGRTTALFRPEIRAGLDDAGVLRSLTRSLADIPQERDPLNRLLFLEGRHFLADHNLNYTDKMGMAAGIEIRTPLLDTDLVEFAARVPPQLKQRRLRGKYILKRAMEPLLPHQVVHRRKTGFGAPLRRWMRGDLNGMTDELLSPAAVAQRGIFEPEAVQALVRDNRAERTDGAYLIFAIVCLELWCRSFLDDAPPRTAAGVDMTAYASN